MGKVFKKITKPFAKVLDKVVPNEIKPALPYLAAVAPFMLSPAFGATMFSSMSPTRFINDCKRISWRRS
jgi:hypothetical protein